MTMHPPLHDVIILDMTRVLAGPYCTMILRHLGARVIKVEKPPLGDDSRGIGPFINGKSAYFAALNRGKESIALSLEHARDRKIFDSLLSMSHVLVENARPHALSRYGYDWETLHRRWPHLHYASISGFGHDGPYHMHPSYDIIAQAMGGLMSLTGEEGREGVRVGVSIGDIAAGLFAVIAILAALRKEGTGTRIDISMLDCQIALLENAIARFDAGLTPQSTGTRHPTITPFDVFPTRDHPLAIAAGNNKLFGLLAESIGRADLITHPLFKDNATRTQHQAQLKNIIARALQKKARDHWLTRLRTMGVPVAPIHGVAEILRDPQLHHRQMIMKGDDPAMGPTHIVGTPLKISTIEDGDMPFDTEQPSPALDSHRHALLQEIEQKS
ncbi:MAG: CoA transferase [Alphaproteobacteria bacterium GM7ARS4]|nr:CoA transferase [Alphaproteobacteria bacterium GM7ARS4]